MKYSWSWNSFHYLLYGYYGTIKWAEAKGTKFGSIWIIVNDSNPQTLNLQKVSEYRIKQTENYLDHFSWQLSVSYP